MVFTDIRLQHYRSYSDSSFDLGAGVNIVVGPNAAGKTNLLEALMVAALGKSYRAKDGLLIQTSQPWARLDVHTSDNQIRVVKIVENESTRADKSFEFDDKKFKRLPVAMRHPVVLFEPNNLRLLHDEPSTRRDYFDDLIEQYAEGYDSTRAAYKRVVAQRNALLKQGSRGTSQIFAWNIRLADLAAQIVTKRSELLENLNKKSDKIYKTIAGKGVKLTLEYETKTNLENYSSKLMNQLEANLATDIERGFTSYGPHRDDIVVKFGDSPAHQSASRGEIRTLLLVLKIIELQILEDKTGKRPLLLLDDVFSELDGARRRSLTEFLNNYQTIITTTDADVVVQHFTDNCTVIPVQKS